jgi:hypothetical protein
VTSNFVSHAKLCSPGNYRTYETERVKKRKSLQQEEDANFPLTKHFRPSSASSQSVSNDRVDDAVVKCIALDMLPINIVEKEGFRFLMSVLQPSCHIPTRAKFTTAVLDQCRQVVKAIDKLTNDSQY